MLDHSPPETHRLDLLLGRRALSHNLLLQILQSHCCVITFHHHQSTGCRADQRLLLFLFIALVNLHQPEIFLLLQDRPRLRLKIWSDNDISENLTDDPCQTLG